MMETLNLPTPPKRDKNIDRVIITCPMVCELYGFTINNEYPNIQTEFEALDNNGYTVKVRSVTRGEVVALGSSEYSLP